MKNNARFIEYKQRQAAGVGDITPSACTLYHSLSLALSFAVSVCVSSKLTAFT